MKRNTQTAVIQATSAAIILGVQLFVHHKNKKLNATIAAGEKQIADNTLTMQNFIESHSK